MAQKQSVYSTRIFESGVMDALGERFDLTVNKADSVLSDDAFLAAIDGVDAVMLMPPQAVQAPHIERWPDSVKIVGTNSVGLDHLDLDAMKAKGIAVVYTPEVLNQSTAETGLLLLLGAARRATEGLEVVRQGRWTQSYGPAEDLGIQMTGKRLGIYGMGRIGQTVAQMARGFDMEINYFNRSKLPPEKEKGATYHSSLESLMKVSEFFIVVAPSTPETRDSVNAETLAHLPDGAIVANIARGDLVHDDSLIDALGSGKVAAAGLDVFAGEPNMDPRYQKLDNVFALPHWGSATLEARRGMGMAVVTGFEAFFAGESSFNRLI